MLQASDLGCPQASTTHSHMACGNRAASASQAQRCMVPRGIAPVKAPAGSQAFNRLLTCMLPQPKVQGCCTLRGMLREAQAHVGLEIGRHQLVQHALHATCICEACVGLSQQRCHQRHVCLAAAVDSLTASQGITWAAYFQGWRAEHGMACLMIGLCRSQLLTPGGRQLALVWQLWRRGGGAAASPALALAGRPRQQACCRAWQHAVQHQLCICSGSALPHVHDGLWHSFAQLMCAHKAACRAGAACLGPVAAQCARLGHHSWQQLQLQQSSALMAARQLQVAARTRAVRELGPSSHRPSQRLRWQAGLEWPAGISDPEPWRQPLLGSCSVTAAPDQIQDAMQ